VVIACTSLESPSKLDPRLWVPDRHEGRWVLNLYPDAREAGGCFVGAKRAGNPWGPRGLEADPERSAAEGQRRARGQIRRYCAANQLNRLGTLTYQPPYCRDAGAVRGHAGVFFRRLRRRTGPLAYLWVPELHADGERYHVHFAVGRYVHWTWIRDDWSHGFIHIKLIGDLPVGSGPVAEGRVAARYLGKYVGKALVGGPAGRHRYEVGQGFRPRVRQIVGRSEEEVLAIAAERMGEDPEYVWDSAGDETWAGPPAVWASWAG